MTDAAATFQLDGHDVPFAPGQSILAAAQAAGHYIPHLCYHPEFAPHGSCKVCTVKVNGHTHASCTTPAHAGDVVESATDELTQLRLNLVQFLFTEGNHFCPSCEKSGSCTLQGVAYELGMTTEHYSPLFPDRPVDASHPDVLLDFNRCILCELCIRASVDPRRQARLRAVGARHHQAPDRQRGVRAAGRHRAGAVRQGDDGVPGGRDPAQAPGLRGADRPAPLRPAADQRDRGRAARREGAP
jgi:[NiFe] hydrogenase diaphorase moiety small subunit